MGKSKKRSRPAEDDEAEAMAAPPRAKKARTAEAAAAAASTSAVAESPRPAKKKRKSKKTEKEDEDGVELEDDGQREKGGGKVTTVKVHGRPRVHVQADAAEAKPALVPAKEYYDVEKEEKKRKKRERRENKAGRKAAGVDAGADAEGPKPTVKSDAVEAAAAKAAKSARKKKTKKDGKDGDKDGDDENDDDGNDEAKKPPRFIVFVGNLPFTATRESVAAHFAALHPASVRLLTEKADAAKSRGMAFVEFARFDHMQTALAKFHHSDFDDGRSAPRKINVELTAGGGGTTPTRKAKIKQKNKKLNEERQARQARVEAEKAAKPNKGGDDDAVAAEFARAQALAEEDGIHPSRRGRVPHQRGGRGGRGGGR